MPVKKNLEQKKRRILWVGVGTLMIFVVALWLVNVRTQMTDAKFNLGTEEMLWQTAKDDFSSLVKKPLLEAAKTATATSNTLDTEEIKKILAQNLPVISVPSSTTSTLTVTTNIITSSTAEEIRN